MGIGFRAQDLAADADDEDNPVDLSELTPMEVFTGTGRDDGYQPAAHGAAIQARCRASQDKLDRIHAALMQ